MTFDNDIYDETKHYCILFTKYKQDLFVWNHLFSSTNTPPKAHFPLGDFVRATRGENKLEFNEVIGYNWLAKKFAANK